MGKNAQPLFIPFSSLRSYLLDSRAPMVQFPPGQPKFSKMEKIMRSQQRDFSREKHTLSAFCQSQGLHHSSKREAVLEAFLGAEHHLTPEDVLKRLEERRVSVDAKTVQSALDLMVRAGLARELRLEDGTLVYEHAFAHKHHDHLVCRTCGRMIEFSNPAIEQLQDAVATAHHFVVEDHTLTIYGICADCAAKAKVGSAPSLTRDEREQLIALAAMKPGQRGIVREIRGGEGVTRRLAALGIRPGKHVTKVSAMLMGGPAVISVDRRQLALGNGMAVKVMIDRQS